MIPEHRLIIANDAHHLAEKGAQLVRDLARQMVSRHGRFNIALSGGSTPRQMHRLMAQSPFIEEIPWQATHFFMVDERVVPLDHRDSNFGAADRDLFSHIEIPEANLHPMPVWLDPFEGADAYRAELADHFENRLPSFDLILLGVGTDGHTASLFPGQPFDYPAGEWVVAVRGGNPDVERITLTGIVINAAKSICTLVSGGRKAALAQLLIEGPQPDLPAAKVRPLSGRLTWLIDREAAALLSPQ